MILALSIILQQFIPTKHYQPQQLCNQTGPAVNHTLIRQWILLKSFRAVQYREGGTPLISCPPTHLPKYLQRALRSFPFLYSLFSIVTNKNILNCNDDQYTPLCWDQSTPLTKQTRILSTPKLNFNTSSTRQL